MTLKHNKSLFWSAWLLFSIPRFEKSFVNSALIFLLCYADDSQLYRNIKQNNFFATPNLRDVLNSNCTCLQTCCSSVTAKQTFFLQEHIFDNSYSHSVVHTSNSRQKGLREVSVRELILFVLSLYVLPISVLGFLKMLCHSPKTFRLV